MPTNAMGREAANPGKGTGGMAGSGSNAAKDLAASRALGASLAGVGRPQRTAHTDFITPKYSWDQANIGNFGITGAVANMLSGVLSGNTYNQGMPKGFSTGGLKSGGGGLGEKVVGPANQAAGGQRIAQILAQRALMQPQLAVPAPAAPWVNPFAQSLVPRYAPGTKTSIYQGA